MPRKTRKYVKKSDWWEKRKSPVVSTQSEIKASSRVEIPDINYESIAAFDGGGTTEYRGLSKNTSIDLGRFQNINSMSLPFEADGGRYCINQAIDLTQKAYANVSIFRNAIEVLTEFSNAPIILKGGDKASKEAINSWFKRIKINQLKEQAFREYYLSGNLFIYEFEGKLKSEDAKRIKEASGARAARIPIRYIVLNPRNVFVENGFSSNSNYNFVKMLSLYEIQRLKNPQTEEELEMYNSLPDLVEKQIKSFTGGTASYIYVPIDPKRLSYLFYKKQSYWPLAIPMGYPILDDIEWKLQLKKSDMAMSRSIEHAILLVTTGETPTEWGGGVNPNNVAALQNLLKNPTLGRVLVADYTTEAKWVIPDFKELLGPEKYEIVDKDIKEGLQTLLMGEDKFANAMLKAKIFMERLKSGQEAFLDEFLQPQIDKVCAELGLKKVPKAVFQKVSLEDEVQQQKLFVRLAELGMLTPTQTTDAIETGLLPTREEMETSQDEYKTQRDKGLYYPLVGGGNTPKNAISGPTKGASGPSSGAGRPSGTKSPQSTKKISPIGTKGSEDRFSTKSIVSLMAEMDSLKAHASILLKEKFGIKELNEAQSDIANTIVKSVVANEKREEWKNSIASYLESPKEMDKKVADEIDEIAMKYDVDFDMALIFSKSRA